MSRTLFASVQVPVSSANTTTSVVAAQTAAGGALNTQAAATSVGLRIKVVSAFLCASVAGTFNFQSHTTTANKTASAALAAGVPLVLPYNPDGWFTTSPGEALDLVAGTATVAGSVNYVTQ